MSNTRHKASGERWALYFDWLADSDLQAMLEAIEVELELRSQEYMSAGLDSPETLSSESGLEVDKGSLSRESQTNNGEETE